MKTCFLCLMHLLEIFLYCSKVTLKSPTLFLVPLKIHTIPILMKSENFLMHFCSKTNNNWTLIQVFCLNIVYLPSYSVLKKSSFIYFSILLQVPLFFVRLILTLQNYYKVIYTERCISFFATCFYWWRPTKPPHSKKPHQMRLLNYC